MSKDKQRNMNQSGNVCFKAVVKKQGYRLYDIAEKKVIYICDVEFNERSKTQTADPNLRMLITSIT